MSNIENLNNLANILHNLHKDSCELNHPNDPYFTQSDTGSGFTYPNTRKKLVDYIKNRLDDSDFISKILSDEFIDEDDPEIISKNIKNQYKTQYSFDDEICELLSSINQEEMFLDNDGESDELDDFISDINTYNGYVVVFDDSDGERVWYTKVPSKDVLNYVIKNEHRKCIGMGCNKYIHMIIKDKKVVEGLVN